MPDPGRLCTGHGKMPSGGVGHRPGSVTAYDCNDQTRFRSNQRHHYGPAQQEHGPPGGAVCGAGRGPQPHYEPRVQQGHLCHPRRGGTAVRQCAHRQRGCRSGGSRPFCAADGPGGLLRERQHPAFSHPHRQPDRAGSFLHRPRAADGAAAVRLRDVIPGAEFTV